MNQTFVAYIRSLRSPCLTRTVHASVLEGRTSMGGGQRSLDLWNRLKAEVGEPEARRLVDEWIAKPYRLR